MPIAVKLDSAPGREVSGPVQPQRWPTGRGSRVARDFAALLAAALAIGLSVGLGMVLAVLAIA